MTPELTALVATVERVAMEQPIYLSETTEELKAAAAALREQALEIERLQTAYDQLTGERFSDRVHVALKDRAHRAETELAALKAEYRCTRCGVKMTGVIYALLGTPGIWCSDYCRDQRAQLAPSGEVQP